MELVGRGDDARCGLQLVVHASWLGFSWSISPEQPLPFPVLLCNLGPTGVSGGLSQLYALQCRCGTSGLLWQSVHPQPSSGPSSVPPYWQGFLQLPAAPCVGANPGPQLSALRLSVGPVAAQLEPEEEEEGCMGLGCTARGLRALCPTRHLLNVTWEHRDFSFNEGGYLVRPTMVVISLNQHRLWEMVGPPDPPGWAHRGGGHAG